MPDGAMQSVSISSHNIRLSLDSVIRISASYSKASADELAKTPDDENLQALAIFAENAHFYLEILKKQIASLEKIQGIVSNYQLNVARPGALKQ